MRATMSLEPPVTYEQMIRTGRFGQSSAGSAAARNDEENGRAAAAIRKLRRSSDIEGPLG
jgi:hypothetical protein